MKSSFLASILALAGLGLGGCTRPPAAGWQGYLEAEFIHVGAPLAGRLDRLAVQRGARIEAGAPLFTLEHAAELAARREAEDRLRSAQARLDDLRKGSRPTELATLEARVEQARASAELSQRELERAGQLFKSGVLAATDHDRARLTHERNRRATEELVAQLATARLGGRTDAIAAAEAEVAAATAARERAAWAVAQKTQSAPSAALVHDTLYREGEFVVAGAPIVSLLPPGNLKVRFFVPEADFATLQPGATVRVGLSGRAAPLEARVTHLSPRPEYTPPILYNRDNRAKLVFMVEAALDPAAAAGLNPGQPVDVTPAR
ncbi:MAG: HlyD family efflux transporter periplasmic adaptor subunit [Opitutaceae bacterium]|nr:HlyD family efflux transporter periplasmic adaptor subunit [Opitutaceae bacterium]